ncbi:MAG: aconitase family protein, partial [bacterium]
PMVAQPNSPDAVVAIKELEGMHINQVVIGSCTNSSLPDMMHAAQILKGHRVADHVSLVIAPGSSSILAMLAESGALADMIHAGARILECGCGPCIGMGQAPLSKGISLRTINRNFKGRSGTIDAGVYLVSPEVAALSAIKGYLSCEFEEGFTLDPVPYKPFIKNPNYFINEYDPSHEVYMGPNIKPVPRGEKLPDEITGKVVLKVGDNISTDHIVPSDSKLLPFRSNVPHLAKFSFSKVDDQFYNRAIANGGGFIVGGDNYGQGSSREHAALVPNYLKIKAVFALSFARIHRSNLINNGILPCVIDEAGYAFFNDQDDYQMSDLQDAVENGKDIVVTNLNTKESITVSCALAKREKVMIQYGGLLNAIKEIGGDF